ncbi:mitochondrial ribosomal protein S30 [Carabus blaptoides fortunei]
MLNDTLVPYNSMQFIQHCTRTHFKEVPQLPSFYTNINVDAAGSQLKASIEDALAFEYESLKRSHDITNTKLDKASEEDLISDSIIQQINRVVLNNLASTQTYIMDAQIDYDPRHEAFWFIGGIQPPDNSRKSREKFSWSKPLANEPINRAVQYLGKPSLAVRTELPLEPVISYSEADNPDFDVPLFSFDPRVLGYNSTNRHGTNIPGFWPGDPCEFGLLSFQRRGHLLNRSPSFGPEDQQEALHSHGIMSSFAWLLSQASYQGFTTYNDLTYPLVAQTVITNGQEWSFYTYQLNTALMHSDHVHNNPKRNICWGTAPQKLFESIDENGKIIGFNDTVLKMLLQFYLNIPKSREDVDMKPYLDKQERIVANIVDTEKREWLENQYKHMMANRPRHRQMYELYHWEKIYKVDNDTRPLEPKRRPFELGINPWMRKYDERAPSYIPKALRPGGPKSKDKFYKSYYP